MSDQISFTAIQGGEDLVSPAISKNPSRALLAENYEMNSNGGITRIRGYERFDGQTRPSTMPYDTVQEQAAMEAQRALITAVPGSGPVRGVCVYNDEVYALRDNAGATAVDIYKSSGAGWVQVSITTSYVAFTAGTTEFLEGETLTQGAVTATIKNVAVTSGDWSTNDAAGYITVGVVSGGNYAAGVATSASGSATLSGAQTAVALPAGGKYDFEVYNFGGHSGTKKMYMTGGTYYCLEFDGTDFIPVITGMATDTPTHCIAHQNYLWLSFAGGSLQNSPLTFPTKGWTPIVGANEFAMGSEITGFLSMPGGVLGIFCEDRIYVLQGASASDWVLRLLTSDAGAKEWSMQYLDGAKAVNDIGFFDVSTTEKFGDFQQATFSKDIEPSFRAYVDRIVTSCVYKLKNQLWVFYDNGSATIASFANGQFIGFSRAVFKMVPNVTFNGDISGKERLFVGANDGFVYEMQVGNNFDGAAIESYLRMAYDNMGSPRTRKRFKELIIELESVTNFTLQFQVDFDYASIEQASESLVAQTITGAGGYWNVDLWDDFVWSGTVISEPTAYISGTARNISVLIYSTLTYEEPYTIHGLLWRFTPRRLQR